MKHIIPFQLLSKHGFGFHLVMKMQVNGKVTKMIIDTGASHTVFDKKRMQTHIKGQKLTKFSKSTTGVGGTKIDTHHTIIKKMKIGKLEIIEYPGIMLDLSHVNASFVAMGLPEIDGVLGADIFLLFNAIIDYKKRTLTLNDSNFTKVEKVKKVPVERKNQRKIHLKKG